MKIPFQDRSTKADQESEQLILQLTETCDVDGFIDARGIQYIGIARRQLDGSWRALAIVPGGALCVVECSITLGAAGEQ